MRAMPLTLKTALAATIAATARSTLAALPVEHRATATGVRMYLVSSPSIPMLDIDLDVDAGSHCELVVKMGLAFLTAGMLNKGVAAQGNMPVRDGAATTDAFADVGASLGDGVGGDRMSLCLRTLSDPTERGLVIALMTQTISTLTFPDTVLVRDRQHLVAAIRESLIKPLVLTERAFGEAIYGTHLHGQTAAPETAKGIARNDIVHYCQANYTTKRAVVTPIDAISRQEAKAIAEQITRGLSAGGTTPPALSGVEVPLTKAETTRIPYPVQQATIALGQPGIVCSDKDYFPLLVGNYTLGGDGLSARLTSEVRGKRGPTYNIGSRFAPATQSGPFELALQARKDQIKETPGVVCDTTAKFVADGLTDVELRVTKDNLVSGFPLRLDSNRKLLDNVASIGWYNLPLNYLDTWTQRIATVMRDQVHTALQCTPQPQTMMTVVVGDPEKAAAN